MKTRLFSQLLILSAVVLGSASAFGGPGSGNGTGFSQLEGFENYAAQSSQLRAAIEQSVAIVKTLGLTNPQYFPELTHLEEEIKFSRYILIPNDVVAKPNRAPGDYQVGTYLVASTDTAKGAPTKIYPTLITQLSATQLVQMVIHEALHRALPEPVNGYEPAVVKLSEIITQYAPAMAPKAVRSYLDLIKTKHLPWSVQIVNPWGGGPSTQGEDTDAFAEGALRPCFDQNLIVSVGQQSRIVIRLSADKARRDPMASITVADTYRQIIYTKNLDGLRVDQRNKAATQFVIQSIQKIQDDLSWQ